MKVWIALVGIALLSVGLVARPALPLEAAKQCGDPSANEFPLKVYISPNGDWSNDVSAARFRELVTEALDNWVELPDSDISYVVTSNYNSADVWALFRNQGGSSHASGFCATSSRGFIYVNAAHNAPGHWDADDSDGVPAASASVEFALTHEFGHMLGLAHNCDDFGIMCVSGAKDAFGHAIGSHGRLSVISPLEQAMVASFYPEAGLAPSATPTKTPSPTSTPSPTITPSSAPTMTPTPASPLMWWCRLWPGLC